MITTAEAPPFYYMIDALNTGGPVQQASYFCLRNNSWQLLAMDTGIEDDVPKPEVEIFSLGWKKHMTSLRGDEYRWHRHHLDNAGDRKTILLSHHQLFSVYEPLQTRTSKTSVNTNLLQDFGPYLDRGKVSAWFWGHEHDFVEMIPGHRGLPVAACIGHGAIPVDSRKRPRSAQEEPPYPGRGEPPKLTVTEHYYHHGFSVIQLSEDNAVINHYEVETSGKARHIGKSYF